MTVHTSRRGEIVECHAEPGECPLGGNHYDSYEDAVEGISNEMNDSLFSPGAIRKGEGGNGVRKYTVNERKLYSDEEWSNFDDSSYTLPEETVFVNDAVAVDPDECGCTDCLTDQSVSGKHGYEELAMQHFDPSVQRPIINRTSNSLYVTAKPREDSYDFGGPRGHYDFSIETVKPRGEGLVIKEIPPYKSGQ